LSTDKELNDFLKSVEKRAFKRAVYAVRNDDAALDIVQEAMIKLADNYAERPPAEWPMLFQRILSNARAFNELATDLLESLVLEGKPLLQWVASALSHRGLG
jgi:DNA-directed RNA polymerase specialized sigma24 family protein